MGRTFGEVTSEVMADIASLRETVLAPPKNTPNKGGKGSRPNASLTYDEDVTDKPPRKGDKGKGKGKRNQWRKRQYDDGQDQWWKKNQWQGSWGGYRTQWDNQSYHDDKCQDTNAQQGGNNASSYKAQDTGQTLGTARGPTGEVSSFEGGPGPPPTSGPTPDPPIGADERPPLPRPSRMAPFDVIGATHYIINQEFGTVSWELTERATTSRNIARCG